MHTLCEVIFPWDNPFSRESQVVRLEHMCCWSSSLRQQLESHLNCSHYLSFYFVRKCYQVGVWLSFFEQQGWFKSKISVVNVWGFSNWRAPPMRMFPVCRCQCFSCGWHLDNEGDHPPCIVSWWNTGESSEKQALHWFIACVHLDSGSWCHWGYHFFMTPWLHCLILRFEESRISISETAWQFMSIVFFPHQKRPMVLVTSHLHASFER